MIKEFKQFIARGNVVDMAVGIIIGAAFSGIVNSLVKDVIMPPIGWLMKGVDFSNRFLTLQPGTDTAIALPYNTLADAQTAGAVTLNYGLFINTIINFLIVAIAVFFLVKAVNKLQINKPSEPTTKPCPYCTLSIPASATRCPNCTSELKN